METKTESFATNENRQADFILGAGLNRISYDIHLSGRYLYGQVSITIKWEVFSQAQQRVVYTSTMDCVADIRPEEKLDYIEFNTRILNDAVEKLLVDENYKRAVATPLGDYAATQIFPIINLSLAKSSPQFGEAKRILPAVVTIENNNGSGSGFYISSDGYILTNRHVVGNSRFVKVGTADNQQLVGTVLRRDAVRDVALVKVDTQPSVVPYLLTEKPEIGKPVYALGSPFGAFLSETLTNGILSAIRAWEGQTYLQSDVVVNPGNSGGPLLNKNGDVIGIAESKSVSKGIGLFIPIDEALHRLSIAPQK